MAGRGDPCNPSTVTPGGTIPTSSPAAGGGFGAKQSSLYAPNQVARVSRVGPRHTVIIDNKDITREYGLSIIGVSVVETCDHSFDIVKIDIHNDKLRYTDDSIWNEGVFIDIWMGYVDTGLSRRGGRFISQGACYDFPTTEGAAHTVISIIGYSEDYLLGRSDVRKTWYGVRDSEVAIEIAKKYGWKWDVDRTEPIYRHIAQVNESDWKFLDRRARYYGYQVYLEGTTLHFHQPRYVNSGIRMMYKQGNNSQLNGIQINQNPLFHGRRVEMAQIDPVSKEIFTVSSNEQIDAVTYWTSKPYPVENTVSSQTIASVPINGSPPQQAVTYALEEGHTQNRTSLGAEVEHISQSSRWLITGFGNVIGLENMRVRTVIELYNLGRMSGQYYITQLETIIKEGNFYTNFKVARTWKGKSQGSFLGTAKVDIPSAGTERL